FLYPNGIDNPGITKDELYEHISFLASDSLKGRKPGTAEGRIAAEYIGEKLLSFGFKAIENKAYQYYDVVIEAIATDENSLEVGGQKAKLSEDFVPFSFSADSQHESEVVFCGYGFNIDTDDMVWNDFDTDLNGKWAMILLGDPEPRNPDSKFIPFANEKGKVLAARDHGAGGVLLVSGVGFDAKDQLTPLEIDQTASDLGIPVFHLTRNLANKILGDSGERIEDLENTMNSLLKPVTFQCNTIIKGNSEVVFRKVKTQNVVVCLEGSDPLLKEEYVVIGGHYDHLGFGGDHTSSRKQDTVAVHYGADDNASGISSLIEIGEYLAANRKSMKRSVILVAFGAEEIGILGSKYFTSSPLVDLGQIKAMINLDMIGRLKDSKDLLIGGVGSSMEGETLLNEKLGNRDLHLSFSYNGLGPSDHAAFYVEDIPVFFFSTGAHEDYHTPEDVIGKLNFDGLKTISEYVTDLSLELINGEESLTFQEAGPKRMENSNRRSKVKLGIMPNFGSSETKGLRVDGVSPGGSADLAGMEKGDVIVAIEGKPIENIYEYMARMSTLKPGMTITVDILRNNK
ncbi:MAG: M28 family peptidase, partial [Bacteroidales bacterium]|nr:M28 family peptidase [Bacteroidales bacterium]